MPLYPRNVLKLLAEPQFGSNAHGLRQGGTPPFFNASTIWLVMVCRIVSC
jgi:hypothetical protein